jgi:enoyl-CoA hydratase
MRHDRLSALEQWGLSEESAIANEIAHGQLTLASGETSAGAMTFSGGAGRHGKALR